MQPIIKAPLQPIIKAPLQPIIKAPLQPIIKAPVKSIVAAPAKPVVPSPSSFANSSDPNVAVVTAPKGPRYLLQTDWRGNYIEVPKATSQAVTAPGSLSTNKETTTSLQTVRVGPDKLNTIVNGAILGTSIIVDVLDTPISPGPDASIAGAMFVAGRQGAKNAITKIETKSVLETTLHGAQRLAGPAATRGGVLTAERAKAVSSGGRVMTQADGAIVKILQNSKGRFDVVIEGKRGLITSFEDLTEKTIARLGKNYGWK